ncbi:MAG: HipA domain-containing protein [Propionivibrio sp.]|nr:HipA domain-containing protein [Propionivibrio sp.]
MRSIIEVFQDEQWIPAAEVMPRGSLKATFEYLIDYVFGAHPLPISFKLPVSAGYHGIDAETGAPDCPAVLLDLVPQGPGRKRLLHELGRDEGEDVDLVLAQYGAYNPIGNLRLDTAVRYFEERSQQHQEMAAEGFALDDILRRRESFLDHLWLHAMLSAGTTGVQGAAPKFLLTQDRDGLWFADAALPDSAADKHWLVKLPRGRHETDYAVLRNEAAYLRVAQRCGLRVAGESIFQGDMLFVPRFDRCVVSGKVQRLAQETLASLSGTLGFGVSVSMFALVDSFCPHVSDPVAEIVEFMRRDILNLALRNTDNHARNSSVQRLPDGRVQLTPLYDFAPMYLDRELIVRSCRWRAGDQRDVTNLNDIVERLSIRDAEKQAVSDGLRSFAAAVGSLPQIMRDCGVDEEIIEHCKPYIEAQSARLAGVDRRG